MSDKTINELANHLPLLNPEEHLDMERRVGYPLTNDQAQTLRRELAIWEAWMAWCEKNDGI
jgi:hypothetical protein